MVCKIFNSIPRETGDTESKWSTFRTKTAEAAALSCGRKVVGACHAPTTEPHVEPDGQPQRGREPSAMEGVLLSLVSLKDFGSSRWVPTGQAERGSG